MGDQVEQVQTLRPLITVDEVKTQVEASKCPPDEELAQLIGLVSRYFCAYTGRNLAQEYRTSGEVLPPDLRQAAIEQVVYGETLDTHVCPVPYVREVLKRYSNMAHLSEG